MHTKPALVINHHQLPKVLLDLPQLVVEIQWSCLATSLLFYFEASIVLTFVKTVNHSARPLLNPLLVQKLVLVLLVQHLQGPELVVNFQFSNLESR